MESEIDIFVTLVYIVDSRTVHIQLEMSRPVIF
jgi:hypothetical protein